MQAEQRSVEPRSRSSARDRRRALVVEDERDIAELIRYHLVRGNYEVRVCAKGADVVSHAKQFLPHLVVLDIMLPQLNGWEICRRLKADSATASAAVIIVTGRVEEADKIRGFELGADDYVTKPFSPHELMARVRAITRRRQEEDAAAAPTRVTVGELEVDRYRFEVRMKGVVVSLTPKEFNLLAMLAGAPGRVFTRDELLDGVWGRDGYVEPRTVDVHVARLRGRFVATRVVPPAIETVRGVGYRFKEARRAS